VDLEGNPTGNFALLMPTNRCVPWHLKSWDDRFGRVDLFAYLFWKTGKGYITVLNTFTGKNRGRIGRIVEMHADARAELDAAQAGDIVAGSRYEERTKRPHTVRPEIPCNLGTHGISWSCYLIGYYA